MKFKLVFSFCMVAVVLCMLPNESAAGEVSSFFLKSGKTVPRVGRSYGGDSGFFVNAPKSIPRIGRRNYYGDDETLTRSWPQIDARLLAKQIMERENEDLSMKNFQDQLEMALGDEIINPDRRTDLGNN